MGEPCEDIFENSKELKKHILTLSIDNVPAKIAASSSGLETCEVYACEKKGATS